MPREVSPNHFWTGVWASSGPIRFRRYTCIECGVRFHTWEHFKAHRTLGCSGRPSIAGKQTLSDEAREALLDHLHVLSVEEELEATREVTRLEREVSLETLKARELDT